MYSFFSNGEQKPVAPESKAVGVSPRTMVDKIWDSHLVNLPVATPPSKIGSQTQAAPASEARVDHVYLHEHELGLIARLGEQGVQIHSRHGIVACADQQISTRRVGKSDSESEPRWAPLSAQDVATFERLEDYSAQLDVPIFGPGDDRGGVLNVVGPEQGMTWPGALVVGSDNHMSTHGAFGALGLVLAPQDLTAVVSRRSIIGIRPKVVRLAVQGALREPVDAKDLALWLLGQLGPLTNRDVVLELGGSAVRGLSIEGRMTLCNMMVETGALSALVAPDQKTFDYLESRLFAPKGHEWERSLKQWRALVSDAGAPVSAEWALLASGISPQVSWGTRAWQSCAINGVVPDPHPTNETRRKADREALFLQGLEPGQPINSIAIDQVFIGSCTNGRIEDLRAAAKVLQQGSVVVPTLVVPGSQPVARQAEAEGLPEIFLAAGAEWRAPGCSLCIGANGDAVAPGTRLASTANNPSRDRVGPDSRVHVLGPTTAAATALRGFLYDANSLGEAAL
ncbi:MAG: aconitase family protein [Acidimicrobiia bacterium]